MVPMTGRRRVVAALMSTLAIAFAMPLDAAAAGFTFITVPNPGTVNTVGGLVAFSPTDIWSVGSASSNSYAGCHGRTLAARFNGTAFVEVPASPVTPMCAAVNGVAGRSTSDIWAVGSTSNARETHIRHWNGSTWTTIPGAVIPVSIAGGRPQRSTELNAVAELSGSDAWAVGRASFADFSRHTLIEHWNGSAWSLVSSPTAAGSVLYGLAATSSTDIWAVGQTAGTNGTAPLTIHWTGSSWVTVASPSANLINTLRGVVATSANDVWAVGTSIKNPNDGVSVQKTLIEHWNGSAWSIVASPNMGAGNNVLVGVAARSASDVWAVGYDDDLTGSIPVRKTLVLHWNGSTWTRVASPNVGTGDNTPTSITAPAGSSSVWISGVSPEGTFVLRYAS